MALLNKHRAKGIKLYIIVTDSQTNNEWIYNLNILNTQRNFK
jgi:hypothetical protein